MSNVQDANTNSAIVQIHKFIHEEIEKGILLKCPREWKPVVDMLHASLKEKNKDLLALRTAVAKADTVAYTWGEFWKFYTTMDFRNALDNAKYKGYLVELGQKLDAFEDVRETIIL
jgi:hypothetical protein